MPNVKDPSAMPHCNEWTRAPAIPPGNRWLWRAAGLGGALLLTSAAPTAAPPPTTAPLPHLPPLAAPAFDERFEQFDHGTDQARPARPHRWRTVYGHGGGLAISNREMSASSFASDAAFTGVNGGVAGAVPLGLDPFVFRRGELTILGQPTPERLRPRVWGKPYYGGAITTRFSFAQKFGYFEIEARLPAGKGMWPAFWLLPVKGTWPDAGEIDVFEGLGNPHEIHCTAIAGKQRTTRRIALAFDASRDFHRYGVLWTPRTITWFVDREAVASTATPAPLTQESAYLIANLAVGGSWPGQPDASTPFPGRYAIRRITVWPLE
ncbi:family 16 glycosylhydrolase [Sphingomonas sp. IC081]|uniref:glycoside hydrolase family 16 protein n=1 Tax=Sphingomonas sp. IC081 TaxID=304378 RepID=UPI001157332D|nr:glycoside hydrolase family 16 protein [Sphingomonas sp. IC081]QDK31761.1 hypothetical protein DM450_02940 [Sphingomonas sp. IC081]